MWNAPRSCSRAWGSARTAPDAHRLVRRGTLRALRALGPREPERLGVVVAARRRCLGVSIVSGRSRRAVPRRRQPLLPAAERRGRLACTGSACRRSLRGAHHQAPRRLRALAHARGRALRGRLGLRGRSGARVHRRRARGGSQGRPVLLAVRLAPPRLSGVPRRAPPVPLGARAGAERRTVGALPRVPARAAARPGRWSRRRWTSARTAGRRSGS